MASRKKSASPTNKRGRKPSPLERLPLRSTVFNEVLVVAIGSTPIVNKTMFSLLDSLAKAENVVVVIANPFRSKSASTFLTSLKNGSNFKPRKAVHEEILVPGNCYVVPQNTIASLQGGALHLTTNTQATAIKGSIDYLFSSVAANYAHNAIGILLAGVEGDGVQGLLEIKEQGGITLKEQEPSDDLPKETELQYIDLYIPASKIASELKTLVEHRINALPDVAELAKNEKDLKAILNLVYKRFGVDFFSNYKRTTVYRRVLRRMGLGKVESLAQYAKVLQKSEGEVNALYHDFLINVTSFFREPSFYEALTKTVFPQLIKNRKATDPVRIWIPGCATGEEAYSTGICIAEFFSKKNIAPPIQIFATDLDTEAVHKARLGIYPKAVIQNISADRVKKYFIRMNGHYQIVKSIRDMCIFSVHNLMKDPPFSRIDLISCQNVLIYIESAPQRKILHSFHYSLKPGGFLILGKSESVSNSTELFHPVEKDSKVYVKKNKPGIPKLDLPNRQFPTVTLLNQHVELRTETDVEKEFDKVLLSRYVLPSVLVNKDLDILRFRGATARFFEPATGKASLNLLKMVKEELLFELRGLMQKAKKSQTIVSKEDIQLESTGQSVSVEIAPIKTAKDIYYLISFRDYYGDNSDVKGKSRTSKKLLDARLVKLEHALKDAREQIRATTEDFDKSREELQSANEEILSSNEELQSINEELETSKEELQSSNEELTTINEELETRIDELKLSKDYIEAIVETIRGPLLVLTAHFKIEKANKAFYDFFSLKPQEAEDRYLNELADGDWDIPALHDHIRDMIPKKINFRDFEINHKFPRVGSKTMILNAHRLAAQSNTNDSFILLSFEDITRYRNAERQLVETQEQLRLALEGGNVGTWMWNVKTNEISGSREQAILFGLNSPEFTLSFEEWQQMVHPDDLGAIMDNVNESLRTKKPLDTEFRIIWQDTSVHWILTKANIYYDTKNHAEKMMGVNIDITERKRAVEALEESERRFHTMSDNAPVMIWMSDDKMMCNFLNKTWLSFRGKTLDEECGEAWYGGIHPEDRDGFINTYKSAYDRRHEFKYDYRLKRFDGEYRWIMSHGVPRYTGKDEFIGYIGTSIDINERIDLERQKDDFMSIASHELKTPVTSIKAYAQILEEKFRKGNDQHSANMLSRLDVQIDKLTSLINTLLDVAKIQSGQMEYDPEVFDVREFISEVKEDIQHACPTHEIILKLNSDGTVKADKARTSQVLNNLILNAVKYSPEAQKIIVQTDRDEENNLIFTVQDFGVGIPKEMQEKIFGRFFRVSEAAGNRVSGLGLGLYITSQIVRQQGGRIWLESNPGKGSKFSFLLPDNDTNE